MGFIDWYLCKIVLQKTGEKDPFRQIAERDFTIMQMKNDLRRAEQKSEDLTADVRFYHYWPQSWWFELAFEKEKISYIIVQKEFIYRDLFNYI